MKLQNSMLGIIAALSVASCATAADIDVPGYLAPHAVACPMPNKCIKSGLYLTARSAFQVKENLHDHVILIDVRTPEEAAFKGVATSIDGLVPLKSVVHPVQTDATKGTLKMRDNSHFVDEVTRLVELKKRNRHTPILVMCGGGWRSGEAADKLIAAGYTRVYNVVDGLDGDFGPDGKRDVNGWKKAGLPWNHWVERHKLYLSPEDEKI